MDAQRYYSEAERVTADRLRLRGWEVVAQPSLGSIRPDLIVKTGSDHAFIVEMKLGPSNRPVGFSDVAVVSSYAEVAKQMQDLVSVFPILLTTRKISDEVRDAAKSLGVQIVSVSGTIENAAQDVVRAIEARLGQTHNE